MRQREEEKNSHTRRNGARGLEKKTAKYII